MKRALPALCALLLATPVGGCSFYWTQGPDRFTPPNPPMCNPDVLPPGLDAVLAAAFTAAAVTSGWDADRSPARLQAAIANGAVAAVFAASGTVGFVRMGQCAAAHDTYRRWLTEHPTAFPGEPGTLPPAAWLNPPALSEEEAAEQAWQQEQARRFDAEKTAHTAAVESLRQAHPRILATLSIRNEGGDSTFAVRVRMEDTEEDLQTLDPQPLSAHAEAVYPQALQAREGIPTEISLVVRTGPSETVLPLDAALRAGATLHVTFAWDASAGRFVAQQAWQAVPLTGS